MDLTSFFPTIIGVSPNTSTADVSTLPTISVTFNIELDSKYFNTTENLNNYVILVEENSDTTIGVVFVSYLNKVLKFTPATSLTPGLYYQVTILRGIPSIEGRQLQANRSFAFKVAATDVPQVSLLEPSDYTSVVVNPTFSWQPVSYSTTGTLSYDIEVDRSTAFNTVSSYGWTTSTTSSSALPGISLTQGVSYFWRVRAVVTTESASYSGLWSDSRTFYLGSFLQPSPSTQQTYAEAVAFHIDAQPFSNGASNLSTYPSMTFTFSSSIDPTTTSAVTLTRESVDGYPAGRTSVPVSINVSGTSLEVVPLEDILVNNRYVLTFGTGLKDVNGNSVAETTELYFTSRYSPLYLGCNVIRANFGKFIVDYPDDLLNFHIFRVSLDVNREWILYYASFWGSPTEADVRNQTFQLTYPMERWVEHETALRILRMKYYELLESADSMKKLGDYTEQHGATLLRSLSEAIKKEEQEANKWISQFSRHRPRQRTAVKSAWWPQQLRNLDISFTHRRSV